VDVTEPRPDLTALGARWRLAFLTLAVATAVIALAQRHAFTQPSWSLAYAALVVAAFVAATFAPVPKPLLVAAVIGGVAGLLLHPTQIDVAPFLLVFLVADLADTGAFSAVAGLASVGLLIGLDAAGRFSGSAVWVLGVAFGWAGGIAVCAQMRLVDQLRTRQDELVTRAALEERQRIAREVHDVVAHSLTVTMLHLTAARLALDDDPAEAHASLVQAERAGRESLDEIRRSVGLLSAARGSGTRPMPTACDIVTLVDELRDAGLAVRLEVVGDAGALPVDVGLALYRVAQESLANAAKHAPGAPVEVTLRATPADTTLSVHNACPVTVTVPARVSDGGGAGIPGMHQRAASVGGVIRCGPARDGWTVELTVPAAT
jgi:signal transduction histidine kinase